MGSLRQSLSESFCDPSNDLICDYLNVHWHVDSILARSIEWLLVDSWGDKLHHFWLGPWLIRSLTHSVNQNDLCSYSLEGFSPVWGDLLPEGSAQYQEMYVFPRKTNKNQFWGRSQEGHQGSASWVTPIITQSNIQRITEDSQWVTQLTTQWLTRRSTQVTTQWITRGVTQWSSQLSTHHVQRVTHIGI